MVKYNHQNPADNFPHPNRYSSYGLTILICVKEGLVRWKIGCVIKKSRKYSGPHIDLRPQIKSPIPMSLFYLSFYHGWIMADRKRLFAATSFTSLKYCRLPPAILPPTGLLLSFCCSTAWRWGYHARIIHTCLNRDVAPSFFFIFC